MFICDYCGKKLPESNVMCCGEIHNTPEQMVNERVKAFFMMTTHPYYGLLIEKVGHTAVLTFCKANKALDKGEFERAAQKMFLDNQAKPKNWSTIEDILIAVNNEAFKRVR